MNQHQQGLTLAEQEESYIRRIEAVAHQIARRIGWASPNTISLDASYQPSFQVLNALLSHSQPPYPLLPRDLLPFLDQTIADPSRLHGVLIIMEHNHKTFQQRRYFRHNFGTSCSDSDIGYLLSCTTQCLRIPLHAPRLFAEEPNKNHSSEHPYALFPGGAWRQVQSLRRGTPLLPSFMTSGDAAAQEMNRSPTAATKQQKNAPEFNHRTTGATLNETRKDAGELSHHQVVASKSDNAKATTNAVKKRASNDGSNNNKKRRVTLETGKTQQE